MRSKLIKLVAAGAVTLSLLGAAGMAQASSLTQGQVSAIIGLLQSFGADSTTIANVTASLNGQQVVTATNPIIPSAVDPSACINIPFNLGLGSKNSATFSTEQGGDQNWYLTHGGVVSALQQFLGVNPTGYFGAQTKAAVQNWQTGHGISAIGSVGPATRKAMGCWGAVSTNNSNWLAASLAYGTAPLTVTFTPAFAGLGDHWIEFGDGTRASTSCAESKPDTDRCIRMNTLTHTYTTAGTYVATYKEQNTKADTIGTATITVTSASGQQSTVTVPSISKYTNSQYGFTMDFLKDDPAKTTDYNSLQPFDSKPIVYSGYWMTVNASDKQSDVLNCTVPGKIHNTEDSSGTLKNTYSKNISGIDFAVSDWERGDGYERNYTTVHDNKCFDIQIITVPSCALCNSGRPSLESYKPRLEEMAKIVQTFKFVNPVQVEGMSKYTDADFGFSFWYPSSYNVTSVTGSGKIAVKGNGKEIDIQKVFSPDLNYKIHVGACGTCDSKTYYFDTVKHLWMLSVYMGATDAPASGGQPADISNNTMGGLHIFSGQNKDLNKIVPLSARNFLSISDTAGWNGAPNEDAKLVSLTKTILATDPSVGVPWSPALQTQTILDEKSAFSSQ